MVLAKSTRFRFGRLRQVSSSRLLSRSAKTTDPDRRIALSITGFQLAGQNRPQPCQPRYVQSALASAAAEMDGCSPKLMPARLANSPSALHHHYRPPPPVAPWPAHRNRH